MFLCNVYFIKLLHKVLGDLYIYYDNLHRDFGAADQTTVPL